MNDTIQISDLEFEALIGVPDEERRSPQRLVVTVDLEIDSREAARSDDVKKTVDYGSLASEIEKLGKTPCKTIEKFAEDIACLALGKPGVRRTVVMLRKFPSSIFAKRVQITIERSNTI